MSPKRRTACVVSVLGACLATCGCVNIDREYAAEFYELRPPPTDAQVELFRQRYPATQVTSTQPGAWHKIEPGMTRGMVRTLVGDRLQRARRGYWILRQDGVPLRDEWHVRLYFAHAGEDAALKAIIVRNVVKRWMNSTDHP